ncbi:MAG: ABC transporter permease [Candidatus Hydrogenedens sp.]|nr:ABC transporter permease [Candidatus Hydrogenedens sp.]
MFKKKEKRQSIASQYAKRTKLGEIWYRLKKNKGAMVGLAIVALFVLIAIFADVMFDYDTQIAGYNLRNKLIKPCLEHPFGTDEMGRDLFARLLYGTRFSMAIAFSSVLFSVCVGLPLGAMCGYLGGKFDLIAMRLLDILRSIPGILMGIVIVSWLGQSTVNLVIAIGFSMIAPLASTTRAAVLTVRNTEYVESARSIGISEWRIVMVHIIPNCLSTILVQITLRVANAIIAASSLSFLGLGVPIPSPEWGALLSAGRAHIRNASYLTIFPGMAIMVLVLSLNVLGDGLRDAMDPKMYK